MKHSQHLDPHLAQLLHRDIHLVPDFPQPGVLFRDVTPLLLDPELRADLTEAICEPFKNRDIERVVGIDARGFIFGALVAERLKVGLVPARKKGKLGGPVDSIEYKLEYGFGTLEMKRGSSDPDMHVLIIDDLLATGGTASAAAALVRRQGGIVVGFGFVVELEALGGRRAVNDGLHALLKVPVNALLSYE